eukprot:CAMPEP_0197903990 /NCGR_PEP_ID=MMETSP1439-20131203/57066_1 /TAXON_ID=66791 /ORGANISM="Gonyaulax spinifera, Strain CCMP409" /LENGTH=52 /DNA_ID=CAMNT_0043525151 /DNA_START=70 /DNA_END=226 /DNA_ORIENTATION=-
MARPAIWLMPVALRHIRPRVPVLYGAQPASGSGREPPLGLPVPPATMHTTAH